MRSVQIGIPAASRSKRIDGERQSGFTLIEALVALSVVLAFAAALGPFMFQSHRILVQGDGQVRAEVLLRSLLETPFDRNDPMAGVHTGETAGLRWQLEVEPVADDAISSSDASRAVAKEDRKSQWDIFRITAHVRWGAGQTIMAETLRLGEVK
jgi:prepilin-type N-terminal cleavage/methylation domain-containing protein